MSQVVDFDEVEVVLTLDQIHLLIGPFNPLLISQPMAISDSPMGDLFTTLICHQFLWLPILAPCLSAGSLRGTELKKSLLCSVEDLQVHLYV